MSKNTEKGDVHNFGRSVEKVKKNNTAFFHKPRPIANEKFLFGLDSPLKDILLKNTSSTKLQKALHELFSLECIFKKDWSTYSGYIKGVDRLDIDQVNTLISNDKDYIDNLAYNYGVLSAYSFALGIKDLHIENFILSSQGLHVIDAEEAFEDIKFLCQTCCLGGDSLTWGFSGFLIFVLITQKFQNTRKFTSSDFKLRKAQLKHLLNGYCDLMDHLIVHAEKIKKSIDTFFKNHPKLPMRVILRSTYEYAIYMHNGKEQEIPFLDEEMEQMNRGDIPYFFSYATNKKVFYNIDKKGTPKVVEIPFTHSFWMRLAFNNRYYMDKMLSIPKLREKRALGCIEIFRELRNSQTKRLILDSRATTLYLKKKKIHYHYQQETYEGENRASFSEERKALSLNTSIKKQGK